MTAYRLTLTTPSNQPGFGKIAISRNTYGVMNHLSSLENDVQVLRLPITLHTRILLQHPNENPSTKQRAPPSQKRQVRRQPVQPPGSSTSVFLDFGSKTFFQEGEGSWLKFDRLVLFLVLSPKLQEKNGRGKEVLIAVGAVPVGSKPPCWRAHFHG